MTTNLTPDTEPNNSTPVDGLDAKLRQARINEFVDGLELPTKPMTDAEKCKMLGAYMKMKRPEAPLFNSAGFYVPNGEEADWLLMRFHESRDALCPVLHEIVRRGLYERYKANLLYIVANNVPMIAMITYDNMQVLATPRQLFEAAVKTVEEIKEEKLC